MGNPLFKGIRGANPLVGNTVSKGGKTPQGNIVSQFMQFRREFKGDPKVAIENMIASGQITQEQLDIAVKQAQSIASLFG